MKGYQVSRQNADLLVSTCFQVSNSHGLRCMLPLLLGLVAISGLGAIITCLASRLARRLRMLMLRMALTSWLALMLMLMLLSRLAFHSRAATLEHLHSLLCTASLLLVGLAILQVSTTTCRIFLFLLIIQNPTIVSTDFLAPPVASVNCSMCSSLLVKTNYNTRKAAPPVLSVCLFCQRRLIHRWAGSGCGWIVGRLVGEKNFNLKA